ncbi:MAG: DUF6514 family protein [Clostridiales bacterium]|jgi:hypothetical protein|nr:DUF6514 family protein [Clostridiales bacterium]
MFKELIISKKFVNSENETEIIKYYITSCKFEGSTVYGIAVESYIIDKRRETPHDDAQALKLSYSYNKVIKVIKLLADNLVTPISLNDVLDDLYD